MANSSLNDGDSGSPPKAVNARPYLPPLPRREDAPHEIRRVLLLWVTALCLLLGLIGASATLFSGVLFPALVQGIFDSQVQTTVLQWPGGLEVQVREENNSGWDGDGYSYNYTFSQSGREIISPYNWTYPSTVKQGFSQGTPYFHLQNVIAIYPSATIANLTWRTWDTDDPSLTLWMKEFAAKRRSLRKPRKEAEFFDDPEYSITSFKVQGGAWIIGLQSTSSLDSDWYGGTPKHLHVESRDSGATWKVKERVWVPQWLIELPKSRK